MKKRRQVNQKTQPELSIGIIFQNNIRSLERCLKALAPLREKLLCQLVMADTGSTDGSRTVAEKYADVLFDFPWVDDFAAARNAVMDRCTGRWYITVDSDEYLDEDWNELFLFLCSAQSRQENIKVASVVIRNYNTYEMDGPYSDFYAVRMIRMSTGFRYQGAIHEKLICGDTPLFVMSRTVFHHDGYVGLNTEAGKEKRMRNISALREKLAKKEELLTLLQFIESGTTEEDFEAKLRLAVDKVKNHAETYQSFGPPILRHGVTSSYRLNWPERDEWIRLAQEMFPDSYYTRLDVANIELFVHFSQGDYAACIPLGERCLDAYADFRAGHGDMLGQLYSTLTYPSLQAEQSVRILTASSCLNDNQPERGFEHLKKLAFDKLTADQVKDFVKLLRFAYCISTLDVSQLVLESWKGIGASKKKRMEQKMRSFIQEASVAFRPDVWQEEQQRENFMRLSCGAFQALAGQCEIGTASAILSSEDTRKISELLGEVKLWRQLPIAAVAHAIKLGAQFPPENAVLRLEEMDGLAKRLADDEDELLELIQLTKPLASLQNLSWRRAMVFGAMRIHEWKGGNKDRTLARAFAEVEREFLPISYSETALKEENLFLLPPTHRLGWYCDKAFAALDGGDSVGYVHYLHGGLSAYEDMKEMVNVLLNDFERQQQYTSASPELLELAGKVRSLLSAYSLDDPAIQAIKQSDVYQKVAHLIEGIEVPLIGGLAQ